MVTSSRFVTRSPWRTLAVGVVLAVCTIAAIGAYTYSEVQRLRDEQSAISERNRKDSLQLLRIQNNLASLSALMRDMADRTEPYPLQGWKPAFERIRRDLADAITLEQSLAPAVRQPAQQARLLESVDRFWAEVDRIFALSQADEESARRLARTALIPQHRSIDSLVAQLLIVNNQVQEEAALANREVYDRVAREIFLLVSVLAVVTAAVGAWVVISNRRAFQDVADATAQLRTLSWRMLRVQEDVQRSISRELHDDFGQILTAIGTLLGRVRRHLPPGGAVSSELENVRAIAQRTLDRIRNRSQWLHPGVLDDFGLERALERCAEQFQAQTGIHTQVQVSGPVHTVPADCAIHVYRIVQEALSNTARHSDSGEASIRLTCDGAGLQLEVEDRGKGMSEQALRTGRGMGLVSMRERAELIGGELQLQHRPGGGTTVQVRVKAFVDASPPAEVA
jgi:signal transduction histidine kinase